MRLVITKDHAEMSRMAGQLLFEAIQERPDDVIILAAGHTPGKAYRLAAAACRENNLGCGGLRVVALDEWGGIERQHPLSCYSQIHQSFVEPSGVYPEHYYSLDGLAPEPEEECERYSTLLASLGQVILATAGLGPNGHIGLNEPAAVLPALAHVARLAETTIARAQAERVGEVVAPYGLTLGMEQLLQSQQILLLASGSHKAGAVREMLSGEISTQCPASLLLLHPNVTAVLDESAAALLPEQVKNYYLAKVKQI